MISKRGITLLLLLILLVATSALAQNASTPVDEAYACLEDQLGNNCGGSQNTEETAFNLLAMAHDSNLQSDCRSSLLTKKIGNCWGKTGSGSCNIKSTALAILSLEYIGEDSDDAAAWLLERQKAATGLTWFLEIDANNRTECTINGVKITIEESKKISGPDPSGLIKAYNNYWFEIRDASKTYAISCDRNFITTLLYRKPGGNVFHVSSKTQTAPAHDTLDEKVESFCFSSGTECDYEGSLWAALALSKSGKDISPYLPYISAMGDEAVNKKFIPSAFLRMLTGADDYYSDIINLQKNNQYWDESRNKLYDTALALLALQDTFSDGAAGAKEYLLSIREPSGCWSSDTSFILYAGWSKLPFLTSRAGVTTEYCENFGHFCVPRGECLLEDTLDNFYCPSLGGVCCSEAPLETTCSEKFGAICSADEICDGDEVPSSDTSSCCLGSCEPRVESNACELAGGSCRGTCFDTEEENSAYNNICSFGQICCVKQPEKASNIVWLIILLVILIILVILAIVFRNQLKLWYFKVRNRMRERKAPGPSRRPPLPMLGRPPMPPPRPGYRGPPPRAPIRRAVPGKSSKDREFAETMKKLRDIGK
jgi:hypothetical protein